MPRSLFARPLPALLLPALAIGLSACGGDDGGGTVEPPVNRAPSAPSITNPSTQVVFLGGEQVALTGASSDPDGDLITFTWSLATTRGSSLSTTTGTTTTWTAGTGSSGNDTVTLSVTDGIANPKTTQVTLTVGTAVSGTLAAGAVWTAAQSPYVFTDDVTVAAGQTLAIQPSVVVVLRQKQVGVNREKTGLVVLGTLDASGTALAGQITFKGGELPTANQTQHRGIEFAAGAGGTLRFVRVERGDAGVSYQGGGTLGVYGCRFTQCGAALQVGGGSTVTLRRTLLDLAAGDGAVLGDGDLVARETTFRDCGGVGLRINPTSQVSAADVDSCLFDTNGAGNLYLRDVCTATVHHTNFYAPDGENSVIFSGNAGPLIEVPLDLTACYWGFILSANPSDESAVTTEIRQRTFENWPARAFDVYPYSALPLTLPGAP